MYIYMNMGMDMVMDIGSVPDHDGGRPTEVNACILITHMVYL